MATKRTIISDDTPLDDSLIDNDLIEQPFEEPKAADLADEEEEDTASLTQAAFSDDISDDSVRLYLREIGKILEVTESRVCQMHGEALRLLREALPPEEN